MKKYTVLTTPHSECTDIICDICGKSMLPNGESDMPEGLHLEDKAGYSSQYDGQSLDLDICDLCLKKPIVLFDFLKD
jgi:hypothetical protein